MRKLAAAFAAIVFGTLVFAQSCSSNGPTSPDPVSTTFDGASSTPTASVAAPTPAPSPTPGAPVGERPYVTFQPPLGNGEFCNPMGHQLTLTVDYWNANVFTNQVLLETKRFSAQPQTCVPIPPASEIVKLDCGEKVKLQIDAATTEHLGHIFVDLVGPDEKETVKEEVAYTDWSECKAGTAEADSQGCFRTRTKTVTTTKSYVCKETVVEVVKTEEKEPCKCPCVEQWSGSFTVKADTHENGEYAYRVCTKKAKDWRGHYTNQCDPSSVVWQGWIVKGGKHTEDYPVNGDTLYVQVNLDRRDNGESNPDSFWEGIDESTQAKCGELKSKWNEDISFNCKQVCK